MFQLASVSTTITAPAYNRQALAIAPAFRLNTAVCLIGIERQGVGNSAALIGQVFLLAQQLNCHLHMISSAAAAGSFCFVIDSASAYTMLDALRAALSARPCQLWARTDVAMIACAESHQQHCLLQQIAAHKLTTLLLSGAEGGAVLVEQAALPALRDLIGLVV
jgi:aspartokinase